VTLPRVDDLAVEHAEARLVGLRLRTAHHAAHDAVQLRPTVLVRVRLAGGTEGWGECPALPRPTYTDEYATGAFAVLRDLLLPRLLNRSAHAAEAAADGAPEPGEAIVGHPMAHAAVADALLDASLRAQGRSLADALGASRARLATRPVVTAADADELVARVGEQVDAGARAVGLKASSDDPHAAARAVRACFPDLGLSIDGNGRLGGVSDDGWRKFDELALDEIEQPCAPDDWLGSARVAGCVGCPIALDESIRTPADVRTAAVLGAGHVINVKPARVGGVERAMAVTRAATRAGLEVFAGGLLESGVGRAAALAVAAVLPGSRPTHLLPSAAYWERDLTDPLTGRAGEIDLPEGPGIGRVPDPDRLEAATLERCAFGA
jgi:o-succinylbenzoate synthase